VAETNEVLSPFPYYADPTRGRPVTNGFLFIGEAGSLDPRATVNQKTVTAIQADQSTFTIGQPIQLGAGGLAEFNGTPVVLQVEGAYSILVTDSNKNQVLFFDTVVNGTAPSLLIRNIFSDVNLGIPRRLINATLFAANTLFIDLYNANTPFIDYGVFTEPSPFELSDLPVNRIDYFQGNSIIDFGEI